MAGNSVSFAHPAIVRRQIVLMGPPGALFHRILNSVCSLQDSEAVSADSLVETEIRRGTAIGVALQKGGRTRKMLHDNAVALIRKWYWTRKTGSGFVITGFPANRRQALVFDEWLDSRDESLTACIAVTASESESLSEAQTCYACPVDGSRRYHRHEPDRDFHCSRCGTALEPAAIEAVAEVRSWFDSCASGSQSVMDHYRSRGLLVTIEAGCHTAAPDGETLPATLESLVDCA